MGFGLVKTFLLYDINIIINFKLVFIRKNIFIFFYFRDDLFLVNLSLFISNFRCIKYTYLHLIFIYVGCNLNQNETSKLILNRFCIKSLHKTN